MASPQIIAGSSSAVSIKAGTWTKPDDAAAAHCNGFDKRAVFVGKRRLSENYLTDLFFYDCEDPTAE